MAANPVHLYIQKPFLASDFGCLNNSVPNRSGRDFGTVAVGTYELCLLSGDFLDQPPGAEFEGNMIEAMNVQAVEK